MPDGRYVVRLPFKSGPPINIGNSLKSAKRSLAAVSKRFVRSPELLKQYKDFMIDYENKNHMSQVTEQPREASQIVYLPHYPVIRESSVTTKLRVVFNASAKTSNFTSLNDHLHIGPKLQTSIFDVLLQWRTFRLVYASDIAQMYRQILLHDSDRDYQRILWTSHQNSKPVPFQLNTVTYGTASAPYLALRVVQQLVEDEGSAFPLASKVLMRQIYIDDCLFGADSEKEILKIREEVRTLLGKGKFQLQKWASNSAVLLKDINPAAHGLALEKPLREDESVKVLGLIWIPVQDSYSFRIQLLETSVLTKRSVLSLIARLYDPLGWVSPVIIIAKEFMQKLWLKSLSWDEPLSHDLINFWDSYYKELRNLEQLSIPRWTGQGREIIEASLQGFSDTSKTAYAAVVYLRLVNHSGEITTTLLASRTRVAPIKTVTIPRLELCGALSLTQLMSTIKTNPAFEHLKSSFWTDSTIVLAWLGKHPSSCATFEANRVAAIQSIAPREVWQHVRSGDNPADLASRGIRASDLLNNHLWWRGPEWLSSSTALWPVFQDCLDKDMVEEGRVERELAEEFAKVVQGPHVQTYLINDQIRWSFIPPAAAHFGGIWESGVRSVKHHLRRILMNRAPTFEELSTLLCQIEMCLHSRPLCPVQDDPEDLRVLTPGHFLIGGEFSAIPEVSLHDVKENRLSRWQLWQQILESFWKSWSEDYLLSLQQRNKWRLLHKNLCINQLVLVKQDTLSPTKWPLGRITQVKKGSDGLVRVATVRTATGSYTRPVTKLALLPVKHLDNDNN